MVASTPHHSSLQAMRLHSPTNWNKALLLLCSQKEAKLHSSHRIMGSKEDVFNGSRILVGVSTNSKASFELLSWGIETLARSNDTFIALHVLVAGERKNGSDVNRFRQAKAAVISILGEFAKMSQTKQVRLEAKVKRSGSISKGLAEEAALLDADFLLLGGPRSSAHGKSYLITKYCIKHIPESCSVVSMGKRSLHNTCSDYVAPENHNSFRWTGSPLPITKLFGSKAHREKRHSSFCHESSPAAILDGVGECHSPSSNHNAGINRTNIWRRLSIVGLLPVLFRSAEDPNEKDMSEDCLYNYEEQKPSWRCFGYEEISHATNNFHPDNVVGRGGYSEVFKGIISSGLNIAVKRLSKSNKDDKEKEFLAELGILGHVCHPNTTSLIGCCFENGFHLIFDFCPNGSLSSALHGSRSKILEWPARYKIAIGIARGLHYLHKDCRRRIIHRDIKASNVLLGSNYEPQISDFGLAKWLPKQLTHHSVNPIEGTFGYLAPEYFTHGMVDEKTDVFAFGVLLLEIVTGMRPIDTSKQNLLVWAKPLMEASKFTELADPRLEGGYDKEQLQRLVLIASHCVRPTPIWRPSMSEVLQLLSDGNDWQEAWQEAESRKIHECQSDEFDDFSTESDIYFA